jgi:anti-anti-sigma factor
MNSSGATTAWFVINAKVRIDSFNQETLKTLLTRSQESGFNHVALDLRTTRFISIQAIQTISRFAESLKTSGGTFALLGPTERAKRHFEIYGSLKAITVLKASDVIAGEKVELFAPESSAGSEGPRL